VVVKFENFFRFAAFTSNYLLERKHATIPRFFDVTLWHALLLGFLSNLKGVYMFVKTHA
jgi:hypothetical protein